MLHQAKAGKVETSLFVAPQQLIADDLVKLTIYHNSYHICINLHTLCLKFPSRILFARIIKVTHTQTRLEGFVGVQMCVCTEK